MNNTKTDTVTSDEEVCYTRERTEQVSLEFSAQPPSFASSHGKIREKFVCLVVEQIRRLRNQAFDGQLVTHTKDSENAFNSRTSVICLKLYAGQINSILTFFTDLLLESRYQSMAAYYWNGEFHIVFLCCCCCFFFGWFLS